MFVLVCSIEVFIFVKMVFKDQKAVLGKNGLDVIIEFYKIQQDFIKMESLKNASILNLGVKVIILQGSVKQWVKQTEFSFQYGKMVK